SLSVFQFGLPLIILLRRVLHRSQHRALNRLLFEWFAPSFIIGNLAQRFALLLTFPDGFSRITDRHGNGLPVRNVRIALTGHFSTGLCQSQTVVQDSRTPEDISLTRGKIVNLGEIEGVETSIVL